MNQLLSKAPPTWQEHNLFLKIIRRKHSCTKRQGSEEVTCTQSMQQRIFNNSILEDRS
eukprot:gene21309-8090_t